MLHASGAASTLQRRGIPHTRHSCGCASVPPDPTLRAQKCRRPRAEGLPSLARLVDLVSRAYIQGDGGNGRETAPQRTVRSLGLETLTEFYRAPSKPSIADQKMRETRRTGRPVIVTSARGRPAAVQKVLASGASEKNSRWAGRLA